MASTHPKICPICNASNHADSLFCEECGASIAQVGSATQTTSAFAPVSDAPDTNTVQIPLAQPAPDPGYTTGPAQVKYTAAPATTTYGYVPEGESIRGAVLGWIAVLLMLVIVGFFAWSTLLSDTTRDRFTGFF